MADIKVGDVVRVTGGSSAPKGEVFTVTNIVSATNPYNRRGDVPEFPGWFAEGDINGRGVWAQFLEPIGLTLPTKPQTIIVELGPDTIRALTEAIENGIGNASVWVKHNT